MNRYYIFSSLLLNSCMACAERYPVEFADFFEERSKQVELIVAGEKRGPNIKGRGTYDSFRLVGGEQEVRLYLQGLDLNKEASDSIISQLKLGIKSNSDCKGALDLCIPFDIPNEAEYVYDFDARRVRIFVDSSMLNHRFKEDYHSPIQHSNALMHWFDMYSYSEVNGESSFNLTNDITLGLPSGFLSFESQYAHREKKLRLHRALYDYEVDDFRVVTGYQGRTGIGYNSTDFLYSGANYAGFSATIGRSQNLLKGESQSRSRFYFFAPQVSQLEVYQGEQLLFSKVVSRGQQSIGYDELPSGVYDLTIKLKQADKVILQERRLVANTTKLASLPFKRWDYRVDAGLLKDFSVDEPAYLMGLSTSDRSYLRWSASYRPYESLLVGAGVTGHAQDAGVTLGGGWAPNDHLMSEYVLALYDSGARYHYAQVSVGAFYSSYRYIDTASQGSYLTNALYGPSASTDWSLGVGGQLLGGAGAVSYSNYSVKAIDNPRFGIESQASSSSNVSMSWVRGIAIGQIELRGGYSHYKAKKGTFDVTLSLNIPFKGAMSAITEFTANQDGFSSNRTSVTYNDHGDYGYTSASLGGRFVRDNQSSADAALSLDGNGKLVRYSSFAYVDSEGKGSLSAGLSGTQIFSSQGVAFSHDRGRSFVDLSPRGQLPSESFGGVNYNLYQDGRFTYQDDLKLDESKVLVIKDYTDIHVELDSNLNNLEISDGQLTDFVMPGYYYRLNSQVTPLSSQVFLLNDMSGGVVFSARCYGDDCQNSETLSDDGVVRVHYKKGGRFKLVSQDAYCVYDEKLMGEPYIKAYCLPGIELEGRGLVSDSLINLPGKEYPLKYLGQYRSTPKSQSILRNAKRAGLFPEWVSVGGDVYVYVRHIANHSALQRKLIDGLDAYAVVNSFNEDQSFTGRF